MSKFASSSIRNQIKTEIVFLKMLILSNVQLQFLPKHLNNKKKWFDHNTNKSCSISTYQQHIQDMTKENPISLSTAPFHCPHPFLKFYLLTEIKSSSMMSTQKDTILRKLETH